MSKCSVLILLAIPLALAGCGESKCDECTDCPSFIGEYYGTMTSLNETCADVVLVAGDVFLNVSSQIQLIFEFRDQRGMWAVFNGSLCNTTEEDDPRYYSFSAYYTPDTSGKDYTLDYSLIGFFTAGYQTEETVYPTSVTATLDLRFRFDDGEICNLTGDIRGEQALAIP